MSDQEIIDLANGLAFRFYALHGYVRPTGFRFDQATHGQEKLMWALAVEAMETLAGTDPNDAVSNLSE